MTQLKRFHQNTKKHKNLLDTSHRRFLLLSSVRLRDWNFPLMFCKMNGSPRLSYKTALFCFFLCPLKFLHVNDLRRMSAGTSCCICTRVRTLAHCCAYSEREWRRWMTVKTICLIWTYSDTEECLACSQRKQRETSRAWRAKQGRDQEGGERSLPSPYKPQQQPLPARDVHSSYHIAL